LSNEDSDLLQTLCSTLKPRLKMSGSVREDTCYVVVGEPIRRTLSLLHGIARGCWVVSRSWLMESLEQGRWADELSHELTSFSPAVRERRREFEAFGPRKMGCGPLQAFPPLHFSQACRAPLTELRELAKLSGARVVNTKRHAGLLVGPADNATISRQSEELDPIRVEERWFFDSMQHQRAKPIEDYLLP